MRILGAHLRVLGAPVAHTGGEKIQDAPFHSYKKSKSEVFSLSVRTCFLVIFGAAGAENLVLGMVLERFS